MKIKIIKGNKRDCVKDWPLEKALEQAEKGNVKLLEDVEQDVVHTCEGIKADGTPCQMTVKSTDKYCRYHKE